MSTDEKQRGTMEEEALKRKERLKALKRTALEKSTTNDDDAVPNDDGNVNNSNNNKKPKFRNYQPQDEKIKETAEIADCEPADIESAVQSQLDLLKTPIVIDEIDISNLAPRKPDWDLKRDVAKKLEKLELRTQRAIAELIRERLKTNQENMLEGVNLAIASTTSKLIRPGGSGGDGGEGIDETSQED